jgi:hypothetical protein
MSAPALSSGCCSICKTSFSRKKSMFGREVCELERPLRDCLPPGTRGFVCDTCLLKVQPIQREDTAWARQRPGRVMLCSVSGWHCEAQLKKETREKYTDPIRTVPESLSVYKRRELDIADYAKPVLCKRCDLFCRIVRGITPSTPPKTPKASPAATPPSSKRRRVESDADHVRDALRCFPSGLQYKIAAVAEALAPGVTATSFARALDMDGDPWDSGTLRRAQQLLNEGAEPEDIFKLRVRGPGKNKDEVRRIVVDFLQFMSVPENTGRRPARCPGEVYRVLEDPLVRVLLPEFRKAHPDVPMSVGRFIHIRKKHAPYVHKRQDTPHAGCRWCNDMRFRVDALRRHHQELACGCPSPLPLFHADNLARELLCPKDNDTWWALTPCVLGSCRSCGLRFKALCSHQKAARKPVEWSKWVQEEQDGYNVWSVSQQTPLRATKFWKNTQVYCDQKCVRSSGWLRHLVTARTMHEARRELMRKLRPGDALIGLDFARQFEFYNSYIIPNNAFSKAQATILVVYVVRRADRSNLPLGDDATDDQTEESSEEGEGDEEEEDDGDLPTLNVETHFFVTASNMNNAKTNPGLVHEGLKKVFEAINLGKVGGTRRVFLFSDGEFKQRAHFAWLGKTASEKKVDACWSFYACNHGKDLYDKEGGVFKNSARQHVRDKGTREKNPIKSIDDLVHFGNTHLARPSGTLVRRRHFHKLGKVIPKPGDADQVKGSAKLFSYRVRGSKGSSTVEAREFACFCDDCLEWLPCKRPSGTWRDTVAAYSSQHSSDSDESDESDESDD